MYAFLFVKAFVVNVACLGCIVLGYEVACASGLVDSVTIIGLAGALLAVVETAISWADDHADHSLSSG